MIKKIIKETYHMILFVGYVLFANTILYQLNNTSNIGQMWYTAFYTIGFSLGAACVLSLPQIINLLREKGKKKIIIKSLVFGGICLVLSLSRLWLFTILSQAKINPFILSLMSPILLENLLPFCAGWFFLNSFQHQKEI